MTYEDDNEWIRRAYSLREAGSTTSLMSLFVEREGEFERALEIAEVAGETCDKADLQMYPTCARVPHNLPTHDAFSKTIEPSIDLCGWGAYPWQTTSK